MTKDEYDPYRNMSDVELREYLKWAPASQQYQHASEELSRRERDDKLHQFVDKQENQQWQNHIQTVLDRTDRKTFWILIIAVTTLVLSMLLEVLKK